MSDWYDINGIEGRGDLPSIADTRSGTLMVMGSGVSLWDDIERYPHDCAKLAVNATGVFYPHHIDHWVTLHPDHFEWWIPWRQKEINAEEVQTHSHRKHPLVKNIWDLPNLGGTSGLFGVFVGLALGYENIVCAGLPIDNSGYFYFPPKHKHRNYGDGAQKAVWISANTNVFKGRVKSMSGNTRKWLGEP